MKSHALWLRILIAIGIVAMLGGAIDPLEGSVAILFGSGMIALGTFLEKNTSREIRYWMTVFILIALGVGAMIAWSAAGGLGGNSGRSMWWALTILPYPIGWIMGLIGLIRKLVQFLKMRRQHALA